MSASIKRQLDDVTECPICVSKFTDPRVLPCIHTYCLKCIREWFKDKQSGDEVPCPLCRKDFAIPEGGLDALPKNIFVMKVMNIKDLSSNEKGALICDLCESDDESMSTEKIATMYCIDCQQKLCAACTQYHTKFKQTSLHKSIDLREKITEDALSVRCPPSFCEKHKDKLIEIYCFDCKEVSCMMCFVKLHKSHNCSDISEMSEEFQTEMSRDLDSLTKLLGECSEKLKNLDIDKEQFIAKIDETEKEVCDHAQRLHDLVERDKSKLLDELSEIRRNREKEMVSLREQIEQHSVVVGSLKTYLEQVKCKGTASDIVREANSLKIRSHELVNVEVKRLDKSVDALGSIEVSFSKVHTMLNVGSNNLGKITTRITESNIEVKPGTPTLVHVIQATGDGAIQTMAIHGSQLFVGRATQVDVYDTTTFSLQRSLSISDLDPIVICGLAPCDVNNCLYVSEFFNPYVHKVDLSTYDVLLKWSVAGIMSQGLSVNRAHNVIVTCFNVNKIQEYTTVGELVREVNISDSAPFHAIELPSGQLVVSQCHPWNRVSVVGLDGQVIRSYGNKAGSQQSIDPRGMALYGKQGGLLVADYGNNRIMVLNSSLSEARQLPLSVDGGVQRPWCLCLDESRGRLYVGENEGQRGLLVFDNVVNIDALFK